MLLQPETNTRPERTSPTNKERTNRRTGAIGGTLERVNTAEFYSEDSTKAGNSDQGTGIGKLVVHLDPAAVTGTNGIQCRLARRPSPACSLFPVPCSLLFGSPASIDATAHTARIMPTMASDQVMGTSSQLEASILSATNPS